MGLEQLLNTLAWHFECEHQTNEANDDHRPDAADHAQPVVVPQPKGWEHNDCDNLIDVQQP